MSEPPKTSSSTIRAGELQFRRVGIRSVDLSDLYHLVLRSSWMAFFGVMVLAYAVVNLFFAGLYLAGGDCINAAVPGSFVEAFSFSVQTLSTIGYGTLSPTTPWAHAVMVVESFVGLIGVAIATGLCFAKFSRPQARVAFSDVAVVSMRSGRPCLSFRMANERASRIIDAHLQVYVLLDEQTPEGERMRRFHPITLERDRSPMFTLSWTVLHFMDADSPLAGMTAHNIEEHMVSLVVILTGVEAAFVQNVHAQHFYVPDDIRFGMRFADILEEQDGLLIVHHERLHDTIPDPHG